MDSLDKTLHMKIKSEYHDRLKKYARYRGLTMTSVMEEMIDLIIEHEPIRSKNVMVEMLYGKEN